MNYFKRFGVVIIALAVIALAFYQGYKMDINDTAKNLKGYKTITEEAQEQLIRISSNYQILTQKIEVAQIRLQNATDKISALEDALADIACGDIETLGKFKVVYYCSCAECNNGIEKTITANGSYMSAVTVAADTNRIPLGSVIHINGFEGFKIVEDEHSQAKGKVIAVYMDSHEDVLAGEVKSCEVYLFKQ